MNNIPLELLLALIGGKEVDLLMVKRENDGLRKRLNDAEARIAELEKHETVVP